MAQVRKNTFSGACYEKVVFVLHLWPWVRKTLFRTCLLHRKTCFSNCWDEKCFLAIFFTQDMEVRLRVVFRKVQGVCQESRYPVLSALRPAMGRPMRCQRTCRWGNSFPSAHQAGRIRRAPADCL